MSLPNRFFVGSIFLLLPFIAIAQIDFGRPFENTIPKSLKLDQVTLRDQVLQRIPEDVRTGPFDRDCFRFAELETEKTLSTLESGMIYTDWQDLEEYLDKVMRKVMPDSLLQDTSIQLYVKRSARQGLIDIDFTGQVFVDIGLLAEVKDEATLASFMAIALTDYYVRDEFTLFLEEQEDIFGRSFIEENVIPFNTSEKRQKKLNEIAMTWLNNAGYDIAAYRECWRALIQNRNNKIRQDAYYLTDEGYLDGGKTFASIDSFIIHKEGIKGAAFLVDEAAFYQYSKAAKSETLYLELYCHNYQSCIEKAFKYHIFDINNPTYVYYIMEGIRQYAYTCPNIWNSLFIVNNYYTYDPASPELKIYKMREHLFKKIPYTILKLNFEEMKDLDKVEGGFYWKDLKFVTYKDAFLFFYRVSNVLDAPECILPLALSQKRANVRKQLLKKYLSYENVRYKDYAQRMYDDNINDTLPNKKLLVLVDFDFYAMQAKEQVFVHDRSENNKDTEELFYDIVNGIENRKMLYLEALKETNLKDYHSLMGFFYLARRIGVEQLNSNTDHIELRLDILSPEFALLMEKYQVNSIEFLYCSYAEKSHLRTSIEAYEKVSNMGVGNFLNRKNKTKSLELTIVSCEVNKKSIEAMVFFDKVSLKYAGTAYAHIINHVKEQFYRKDEALAKKRANAKKK